MTRRSFAASGATLPLLPVVSLAKGHPMTPQTALHAFATHAAATTKLRVVHIDDRTQTLVAIRPDAVATWPSANHHETDDRATIATAVRLVEKLDPTPVRHRIEVRWLLRFENAAGASLLEVYQHSFEAYGFLDGEAVRYANLDLLHFLRATFGSHETTLESL